MSTVREEVFVEVLEDGTPELTEIDADGVDLEIAVGSSFSRNVAQDVAVVEVNTGVQGPTGPAGAEVYPFYYRGVLPAGPVEGDFDVTFPADYLYLGCEANVKVAPTGAPIICDVLKGGVSVYADPSDRPVIDIGNTRAVSITPNNFIFEEGSALTVVLVQSGSTIPGSNLVMIPRLVQVA